MTNLIEIYVFDKKMFPEGCLPLPLDYIYIYITIISNISSESTVFLAHLSL